MILKSFEINKLNIDKNNLILFHGENEGAKKEAILNIITHNKNKAVSKYDENQILENKDEFYNQILSKSMFDNEKIFIIKRATNKILSVIEDIFKKKLSDIFIIINSIALDKKSKLRNLFEKEKNLICVSFYPDTPKTLSAMATKFFIEKKIYISQSNINLIISKCNGDRETFYNELNKIELFVLNKKKITEKDIIRLTNLSENHDISELVNHCLAKNKRKTTSILNENNFNNEDCILIIRSLLNKSKKILLLSYEFEKNGDINKTLSSTKPPIFWKEKDITKQQIYKQNSKSLKNLIFRLNKIELNVKKNINHSINLVTDFILTEVS